MGKIYLIGDNWKKELNDTFTERYDYKFWFNKIKTYNLLLKNNKEIIEKYGDDEFKKNDIESHNTFLKSEIVYTFYHMSESLFILIIATLGAPIPWVQISEIKTSQIKKIILEEINTKKITTENLRTIFYNGILKNNNEDKYNKVLESCDKIHEYLIRLSKIYLKQNIYQSFKHGLRVIGGESKFSIIPEGIENPKPILSGSGDSFTYLELKLVKEEKPHNEKKKVYFKVEIVTEIYDSELFLELCEINYQLIFNIMGIRKQFLKEKNKLGGNISGKCINLEMNYFNDIDLNKIFSPKEGGITRLSHTRND